MHLHNILILLFLILPFVTSIRSIIGCVRSYKIAENRIEKFKYASCAALMTASWVGIIYLFIQWYKLMEK